MNALVKLKTVAPAVNQIVRSYAMKSDLKIKWVRPEKIPCYKPEKSGDLQGLPKFTGTELMKDFCDSKELETANEHVRNLFTLQHSRRREMVENFKENMVRRVYRHDLDYGSMEAKLGLMTARIRSLQEYMDKFPRQSVVKVHLKELIDKRKRFLRYLRRWDYRRFEYVLEKLDLVFKPYPTEYHWITRKDSLRKLTDIHCNEIKENRLEEYRKELESQQVDFLEKKLKTLELIRHEQTECQVPVTVTLEEIKAVRKQYEDVKQKRAAMAQRLKESEES